MLSAASSIAADVGITTITSTETVTVTVTVSNNIPSVTMTLADGKCNKK